MKKLMFALFLLFPSVLLAQVYSDVIQVEGKTADQLYSSAHEWMAIVFNSANDVIQLEDPVNKKLIAKGIKIIDHVVNGISVPLTMHFTFITEFKDGRYRYEIYPTQFMSGPDTEYTYDVLKAVTTKEGLLDYYKSKGIKSWAIGEKQIAKNLEYNKQLFDKVNSAIQAIPDDLKTTLIKKSENNW